MKKYIGNSYDRNNDYGNVNAVIGRVMRLMVIMLLVKGVDNIIVITEVEFVTHVTHGRSVKFLPAV